MIVLCTDYASEIYTGQVCARIASLAPDVSVINAVDDLPAFNVNACAYLLHALINHYPKNCVIVAVVDPGVGGERAAICFELGSRQFTGPDNGLFSRIIRDSLDDIKIFKIREDESEISKTFHGRDVFAPAAVQLLSDNDWMGKQPFKDSQSVRIATEIPDNLEQIIYIDSFGNCFTGISGNCISPTSKIAVGSVSLSYAEKFCDVSRGEGFWYINSIGLVEISVNCASASDQYSLQIGSAVSVCSN